jgi:hypothetical protein
MTNCKIQVVSDTADTERRSNKGKKMYSDIFFTTLQSLLVLTLVYHRYKTAVAMLLALMGTLQTVRYYFSLYFFMQLS